MKIKLSLTDKKCRKMGPLTLRHYPPDIGLAAKTFDWILRCAESAIDESYPVDSYRNIEMKELCANLRKQINEQYKL